MVYSGKCHDPKTYWKGTISKCEPCPGPAPGFEITPNCGKDDNGGIHEASKRACEAGRTFNDGSDVYCRPCTSCHPGYITTNPCSTTTDTQCQEPRRTTEVSTTVPTTTTTTTITTTTTATSQHVSTSSCPHEQIKTEVSGPAVLWAVPLAILIIIILVMIAACVLYMKRKRGHQAVLGYSRRSSYINSGFSSLSTGNDLEDILSPSVLSAPLQTVLDNLDVLEELVILLDPESQGVKNTRHLASHFSFPATWVTYTYSMKESKSPLTAVLEGVTSRQPDSTVGHLAKVLRQMERNDAIAVLTKLKLKMIQQV
ncbi:IGF-like family receptor 1 isoform X1 [Epinephelus moara]|uniref:IGF-like family receptor 1 isoform X1 n=1 Tax=Epinephelus moara TaxID=300413 RepID=UPI00214EADA5|nr:IGF-like family receptor 1 isoform X1 [Epinephelus moara]